VTRPFAGFDDKDIMNELQAIERLCKCDHPNIVQVLGYGQLKPDGAFYFIDMELCQASLDKYASGTDIPGLDNWETISAEPDFELRIFNILLHIANGLVFIHSCRQVHRDLTPHNGL
jgi:serine/threonine protein kinase